MHLGIDFSKDFCGFWKGKWRQVGTEIDANCDKRFFKNSCSHCSEGSKNKIRSLRLVIKSQSKNDQNSRSKTRCLLASFFFLRFLWILRSKLGAKVDQKSVLKTIRKQKASETNFLLIFDRFRSHLAPPKRNQDVQKSMLKWHQNLISF